MGRIQKLKLENIKKANELLDKGHIEKYPTPEQVVLKPSNNVTSSSKSFVNKMNNLKEEDIGGQAIINEEPEKDTYWVIIKAEREDLIKMGGTAKEIARGAVSYDGFNPDK